MQANVVKLFIIYLILSIFELEFVYIKSYKFNFNF